MQYWDEEAKEDEATTEEEPIRVQQEIERLRQEQESIMRRQAIAQHAEARMPHINREQARLIELQYTIDILCQQEQRQEPPLGQWQHQPNANPPPPHNHIPPPPPLFNTIYHHQPPSPPHNFQPPSPQLNTIDPKSPLADHSPLAPWPSHYRAAPPPKYHRNTNLHKFLMCYEAVIASAGGDEATLIKLLIISLEDATANWYSRLPPGCIHSWQQLKEKFLLNFQGFQAELDTKEDFLSCAQKEKETLPNFYGRFLQLKS
jgi:hypothetical protein